MKYYRIKMEKVTIWRTYFTKDKAEVMVGKARASAGRKKKVKPLPNPFANMNRGGLMKAVHTDMRKGGLFK